MDGAGEGAGEGGRPVEGGEGVQRDGRVCGVSAVPLRTDSPASTARWPSTGSTASWSSCRRARARVATSCGGEDGG